MLNPPVHLFRLVQAGFPRKVLGRLVPPPPLPTLWAEHLPPVGGDGVGVERGRGHARFGVQVMLKVLHFRGQLNDDGLRPYGGITSLSYSGRIRVRRRLSSVCVS